MFVEGASYLEDGAGCMSVGCSSPNGMHGECLCVCFLSNGLSLG